LVKALANALSDGPERQQRSCWEWAVAVKTGAEKKGGPRSDLERVEKKPPDDPETLDTKKMENTKIKR